MTKSSLENELCDRIDLGLIYLENGRIVDSNEVFKKLIGEPLGRITNVLFTDLIHTESLKLYQETIDQNKNEFSLALQLKSSNFNTLWVRLKYKKSSQYLENSFLYSVENITKTQLKELIFSRLAQDIMKGDSDSLFASVVQSLSYVFDVKYSCVGIFDKQGQHVEIRAMATDNELVNRFSYELEGTPCQDVMSQGCVIVDHGIQEKYPADHYLTKNNVDAYVGIALKNKSDEVIGHIILMDVRPLENVDLILSILNIYAVKLAAEVEKEIYQKELLASEAKYKNLFELAYEAKMAYDPVADQYIEVNKAACELFGYTREELLKLNPAKLKPKVVEDGIEASVHINKGISIAKSHQMFIQESLNRKSDGTVFHSEVTVSMLDAEKGLLLVSLRDISERKKFENELEEYHGKLEKLVQERTNEIDKLNLSLLETNRELEVSNKTLKTKKHEIEKALAELRIAQDQLIQSEKMASLGVLTSGLAHELNNPLNYIGGLTKPLHMDIDEIKRDIPKWIIEKHEDNFNEIDTLLKGMSFGVEKVTQIVENLMSISPKSAAKEVREIDLTSMIISTCQLIENTTQNVDFDLEVDKNIMLKGNEIEINQALINIIKNATEAFPMGESGLVKISARALQESVFIEIADNGIGMSDEVKSQIFEPFFSTKGPSRGTGLGLYISYSAIKKNHGDIKVVTKKGKGTTFTIHLPLAN